MFGIFFVVGVIGLSLWAYQANKKRIANWKLAAAELGLTYTDAPLGIGELSGTVQGIQVSVAMNHRGSGKNRSTWTRYGIGFPSIGPAIEMEPQSLFSGWKGWIGMKSEDIVVGDQAFDDAVIVRGTDAYEIQRFLSPARRIAALTVFQTFSYGHVSESQISAETRGVEPSSERIVRNVRRLVDIAIVVSAPNEVDLALQYQANGMMNEAVTALQDVNASHLQMELPNSFTQLLEAEALMTTSDGVRAKKTLDAIAIGEDNELNGWRGVAAAHPTPPAMPTTSARTEVDDDEPALHLSQQSVIDDLFASQRQSYETEDYFLNTYHGQSVRWTGTVERTREFRYDSVFDGTGQRAIVKIGTRGEGVLVTSTVDAIVHFPSDLALTEDQEITFEGTLVRLDFYMRNLYVAAGRMV